MKAFATTVPQKLASIFNDWSVQCRSMVAPLPKESHGRDMLFQAAESLAILGDASPEGYTRVDKPITIFLAVEWVAQWMGDWPEPGKCERDLAGEIAAVLTWVEGARTEWHAPGGCGQIEAFPNFSCE